MSSEPRPRRGLMLVVSSPSGAGKTTLTRRLCADDPSISLSVSWTTRARRAGEEEGKHYFFREKREFFALRSDGGFLEWAEVHGHFYGSPYAEVMAALEAGKDVLFDIDWQGAQQLTDRAEADVVKVFILPPSMAELRRRLQTRAQDSDEVVRARMHAANDEISRWDSYDYVILNEDLDESYRQLCAIVAAERLRRQRQPWLSGFVRGLLQENS